MEICNREKCTGCAACANICIRDAISMCPDGKGFLYPRIDMQKCISCGKCVRRCPQNASAPLKKAEVVYAARCRDGEIRNASSSGGIFTVLAEQTLRKGGVVFGASYGDRQTVNHVAVTDHSALSRLQGSKYVQSKIGSSYRQVRHYLKAGKAVLFSGTPCQVAGLRAFLGKDFPRLLTVDILCHGVPSPGVFRKHLDDLEQLLGEPILDYRFRSKVSGWKRFKSQIITGTGSKVLCADPYMDGFLRNLYLRPICYQCPFAVRERVGDITLGDYWGYQERFPDYLMDDDGGMSLAMANTEKGRESLRSIRGSLALTGRSMDDASRGNRVLSTPSSRNPQTEAFWEKYEIMDWAQLREQFSLPAPEFTDMPAGWEENVRSYDGLHQLRHTLGGICGMMINKLWRR